MREIRFGLSVWPSVDLRFTRRYDTSKLFTCVRVRERESERALRAVDSGAGLQSIACLIKELTQ